MATTVENLDTERGELVAFRLSGKMMQALKLEASVHGLPVSHLIREAIKLYLDSPYSPSKMKSIMNILDEIEVEDKRKSGGRKKTRYSIKGRKGGVK